MKLATTPKSPPSNTPSPGNSTPSLHHDGEPDNSNLFFRAMCKAAHLTRKELVYDLRVSKTLVDGWMSGEKNDPFTQARNAVSVFLGAQRADLLPAILIYIAGGEEFDGAVLERISQLLKATPR
jgi:hypothetical protein